MLSHPIPIDNAVTNMAHALEEAAQAPHLWQLPLRERGRFARDLRFLRTLNGAFDIVEMLENALAADQEARDAKTRV